MQWSMGDRKRDWPIWRVSHRSMHLSTPSLPDERRREGEKGKREGKDAVQRTLARFWKSAFRGGVAAGNRKKPALFWDRSARGEKKRVGCPFIFTIGSRLNRSVEPASRAERTEEGKRSMCDTHVARLARSTKRAFAFLLVPRLASREGSVSSSASPATLLFGNRTAFQTRLLFQWLGWIFSPPRCFSSSPSSS